MGHLGPKLGDLGATFGALGFLMIFLVDFWSKKVSQREAFWEQKLNKNQSKFEMQIFRDANLQAKKSLLGVILVRFWVDVQVVSGSKMLIFQRLLKVFVKINVFDKDEYPRAI